MARWRLIVAGFGDAAYEAALKAQVRDGRLEHEVSFVGPVNGAEKTAAFAEAKAFVLPSLSEGMPVAALEAWSFGLPAILTTACNLPEGVRSGAAIETAPKTESLAEAIGQLAEMTDQERVAMGQRGRKLVESQFSWPRIADQCRQMYAWLAGGPKPECLWDR
jgi:poly(glycerol-phosphate) alpha-glucosyltransferase